MHDYYINVLQAVHDKEVVHFDLKCDNFLVDGFGTSEIDVALADFGSAADFSNCLQKYTTR